MQFLRERFPDHARTVTAVAGVAVGFADEMAAAPGIFEFLDGFRIRGNPPRNHHPVEDAGHFEAALGPRVPAPQEFHDGVNGGVAELVRVTRKNVFRVLEGCFLSHDSFPFLFS